MWIARAHMQQLQQNSSQSWRFVPDTILPGYLWAPLVLARTPTEHWGQISGKAGWPEHSSAQHHSVETRQTLTPFFFSLPFFLSLPLTHIDESLMMLYTSEMRDVMFCPMNDGK